MRVTVCELSDDMEVFAPDWQALVAHIQSTASQLVVLPEMTFAPWFAWRKDYDPQIWQAGVDAHEQWIPRLDELAPAVVLGSRPVNLPVQGQIRRINQGFTWRQDVGLQPRHEKYYLPDNEGFYEASWYHPGNGTFQPAQVGEVKVGFMVCTDLWFMQHARSYGQQGIHVLACPRATGKTTLDKWLVGGRAAAVISGAYCLSSNRICADDSPATLGGRGWIIDPDGEVLGLTSARQPFITLDIDLARAERAKTTYPRYVKE